MNIENKVGRPQKYFTKEEKKKANREYVRKYRQTNSIHGKVGRPKLNIEYNKKIDLPKKYLEYKECVGSLNAYKVLAYELNCSISYIQKYLKTLQSKRYKHDLLYFYDIIIPNKLIEILGEDIVFYWYNSFYKSYINNMLNKLRNLWRTKHNKKYKVVLKDLLIATYGIYDGFLIYNETKDFSNYDNKFIIHKEFSDYRFIWYFSKLSYYNYFKKKTSEQIHKRYDNRLIRKNIPFEQIFIYQLSRR